MDIMPLAKVPLYSTLGPPGPLFPQSRTSVWAPPTPHWEHPHKQNNPLGQTMRGNRPKKRWACQCPSANDHLPTAPPTVFQLFLFQTPLSHTSLVPRELEIHAWFVTLPKKNEGQEYQQQPLQHYWGNIMSGFSPSLFLAFCLSESTLGMTCFTTSMQTSCTNTAPNLYCWVHFASLFVLWVHAPTLVPPQHINRCKWCRSSWGTCFRVYHPVNQT